jgi:hypothetical protein
MNICKKLRYLTSTAMLMLITGCSLFDLHESQKATSANFSAACMNVIRQADKKDLTVFAVVSTKPLKEQVNGYTIELLANPGIVNDHMQSNGAYHIHHNSLILNFAAVQFYEGDKELGLRLIQLLAKADPGFIWSAPMVPNLTIHQIRKGLESDPRNMQDFLKSEKLQWEWRIDEYSTIL